MNRWLTLRCFKTSVLVKLHRVTVMERPLPRSWLQEPFPACSERVRERTPTFRAEDRCGSSRVRKEAVARCHWAELSVWRCTAPSLFSLMALSVISLLLRNQDWLSLLEPEFPTEMVTSCHIQGFCYKHKDFPEIEVFFKEFILSERFQRPTLKIFLYE